MLASNSPIAEAVSQLKPYLRTHGLSLEQAPEVLALRSQLFEIDSRFGELDDEALFARLDRAGVLDHRVDGVDNIPHAVENPPAGGRAHLRGLCVRRFQAQRNECRCDWQGVWDFRQRRFLDLSDPFVAEEHWSPIPEERRPPYEDPFPRYLESTLRQAFRCYDQGSYEQAHLMLERIRPVRHLLDLRNQVDFLRLDCWTGARSGRLDGESILQDLPRDRRESVWGMLDYVTIYRFRGLVADPAAAAWIQRGQDLLRQQTAPQPEATMAFREHQGCCLMAEGRLGEARDVLEEACRQPRTSDRFARVACRAAATLGEVYRRLGQPGKAREILEQNRTRQMSCGFHGEMAEFTLPSLAKLATEASAAVPILAEARRIQTESHHLMGLARTLLLESRLAGDAGLAARHRQELVRVRTLVPALRQCPLLGEILSHWEQWTDLPGGVEYHGDRFWGL